MLTQIPSKAEVAQEQARRSLMRFIPWCSHQYQSPLHLAKMVNRLERMFRGEALRVVVSAPPRHAKTESLLHFIPWCLWQRPDLRLSYSSYASGITRSKSRVALGIAQKLMALDTENVTDWRTKERGGLLAKSVTEGLTGEGVDIAIVDDPVKDRLQAESARYRERNVDWLQNVLMTRIEPGGSIIVTQTRWHEDDLAGFCIANGFEEIRLPAINDDDEALWPEQWPVEALKTRHAEVGEYVWASLYQGQPRPKGGSVFGDVHTYSQPPNVYTTGIGLDFAYTRSTSSDWSVLVVMARSGDLFYVLDVVRAQHRAPQFAAVVAHYAQLHPAAQMRWYAAGTERGTADFLQPLMGHVPLEVMAPKGDKFTRAIPYAAGWNAGRVLLPDTDIAGNWLSEFIIEHKSFTGVSDKHDDQVDAAVAAYDILHSGHSSMPERPPNPEPTGGLRDAQM